MDWKKLLKGPDKKVKQRTFAKGLLDQQRKQLRKLRPK